MMESNEMAAMRKKRSSMPEATEEAVLLETSQSSARISAATAEAFSTTWMQLFSFWSEVERWTTQLLVEICYRMVHLVE